MADLEKKLTEKVNEMFEKKKVETELILKMPKFKISYEVELSDILKNLGMTDMFEDGTADFSGMDVTKSLYVSGVKQKVVIDVNEEGTEAAAATGMVMEGCVKTSPLEEFTVDHPFIFYIRDKLTGVLLFQGRICDPTARAQ